MGGGGGFAMVRFLPLNFFAEATEYCCCEVRHGR